jgi:hypothetical protein
MRKESGGSIPRATSVRMEDDEKESEGSIPRATSVRMEDDEKGWKERPVHSSPHLVNTQLPVNSPQITTEC